MKRIFNYLSQSWAELGKVNWPKPRQAVKLTITVAVFSLVFAALIGVLDFGLSAGLKQLIQKR